MKEPIYFWKVRTDSPYLEASLIKLGIPQEQIIKFINNPNVIKMNGKAVLVKPKYNDNSSYSRGFLAWNYDNNEGYHGFGGKDLYKGEIELTESEAESIINANKYNI